MSYPQPVLSSYNDLLAYQENSDMLTREQAEAFAHEWIEVWNSHDLDRIREL